tara:strand:+ start:44 stop:427 length:384 start_codon:yes stop_codon:yes gene_type:complete
MRTFKDLITDIQEIRAVSVAARRKIGRRMARLAKTASFKAKKERAMRKIASPMKQRIKANKMAKKVIIKKFYPNYDNFSPMQRAKTDQIISAKYGAAISKIAKRMMLKVKKGEIEKVKKARQAKKDD